MKSEYYIFIANFIAFLHGAVMIFLWSFVVLPAKKIPKWYIYIAVVMSIIGAFFLFSRGICVMTLAENYFRKLGGYGAYQGGFVETYAQKFLHINFPDGVVQFFLGMIICTIMTLFFRRLLLKKRST